MANLLFAARESDSLRSENPGMSQPSRGLLLPNLGLPRCRVADLAAPIQLAPAAQQSKIKNAHQPPRSFRGQPVEAPQLDERFQNSNHMEAEEVQQLGRTIRPFLVFRVVDAGGCVRGCARNRACSFR